MTEAFAKQLPTRNVPEAPTGLVTLENDFEEAMSRAYDRHLRESGILAEGLSPEEFDRRLRNFERSFEEEMVTLARRHVEDVATLLSESEGAEISLVSVGMLHALESRPDAFFSAIRTYPHDAALAMREVMASALADPKGRTTRGLIDEMRQVAGGETYKLIRIARTESTRLVNLGRVFAWQTRRDFDRDERIYLWVVADDFRLCEACREIAESNPYTLAGLQEAIRSASLKHFGQEFGEYLLHPSDRCVVSRNPELLLEEE